MTPAEAEARARDLLLLEWSDPVHVPPRANVNVNAAIKRIAAALLDAANEEREECAKIVEDYEMFGTIQPRPEIQQGVAAAIRGRKA